MTGWCLILQWYLTLEFQSLEQLRGKQGGRNGSKTYLVITRWKWPERKISDKIINRTFSLSLSQLASTVVVHPHDPYSQGGKAVHTHVLKSKMWTIRCNVLAKSHLTIRNRTEYLRYFGASSTSTSCRCGIGARIPFLNIQTACFTHTHKNTGQNG